MRGLADILGRLIVQRAKYELKVNRTIRGKKVRRVASGSLLNSLAFDKKGGNLLFRATSYGAFIHYGVNGTKVKHGAPFSYTNKQPPSKEIEEWIRVKGVRLRKVVMRNGVKVNTFVQNNDKNRKSAAFAIARGIKQNGIAPVPFYDNAIGYVLENKDKLIQEAIEKEIAFILDL